MSTFAEQLAWFIFAWYLCPSYVPILMCLALMCYLKDCNEGEEEVVDRRRPCIEGRLGRHSDTEAEDPPSARSSHCKESELDNTLVAGAEQLVEQHSSTLAVLSDRRTRLEVLAPALSSCLLSCHLNTTS